MTTPEALKEIAADMERDTAAFDGKPFTGLTVGTEFGNHAAAIAALANIVLKQQEQIDAMEKCRGGV